MVKPSFNPVGLGEKKIEWAASAMSVLETVKRRFEAERPLEGQRVAACLHITAETANLIRTLAAGGATIRLCASNPLSTQDDVAAALSQEKNIEVFARAGEDRDDYFAHLSAVLDIEPTVTVDDGADLVTFIHEKRHELLDAILGGTEETTTGVTRLGSMARQAKLAYPIIAVNNAITKHFFDNRYGTGQSTIDGILRATNRLIAGAVFVVAGYGWCGRGLARRAAGMGAQVIVTEVDPIKALEATMDGYRVLPMSEACELADFICTVTGNIHVIDNAHLSRIKNGAIICNAGHFDIEIDLNALESLTVEKRPIRDHLTAYYYPDGRRVLVLSEGRLVNLAAAEGHPPEVMDMSFANQALSVEYIVSHSRVLQREVHDVPPHIDARVASLKLAGMGIDIDVLSETQKAYLADWKTGT